MSILKYILKSYLKEVNIAIDLKRTPSVGRTKSKRHKAPLKSHGAVLTVETKGYIAILPAPTHYS